VLVLAWLYLPGWDPLAHLLGLDRSLPTRMRLFFVPTAVTSIVVLVHRLDARRAPLGWAVSLGSGALVLAAHGVVWRALVDVAAPAAAAPLAVWAAGVTLALALGVALVARRRAAAGAGAMLVASLAVGLGVNPLYSGVFDLRTQTSAGRAVHAVAAGDPRAAWVGVGGFLSMATLVESGVPSWNGVQTYPTPAMWDTLDPAGTHEQVWNRLAHVTWTGGAGAPLSTPHPNPAGDQVVLTFDSCDPFAQAHVRYVLADGDPLAQPCLRTLRTLHQGSARSWVYEVVAPPG
jgi:hypothetical protein